MPKQVGVITNIRHGVFQSLVIAGFQEVVESLGYKLVIDAVEENPRHSVTLDPSQLDGLLVIANAAPDDFLRRAYAMRTPLSLVSHQVPGLPAPTVTFNHAQGIALLVKHLIIGCRRRHLVFIRGIPEQIDAIQRETAFRNELMRHNLHVPATRFLRGDFSPEVAVESVGCLLRSGETFDGILAADYVMASAVVDYLRDNRVAVPQQVSAVGFGDSAEAERVGITTVAADVQELGRCAARQLTSQIKGLRMRGTTTLSVELMIRETCGYHLFQHTHR
jgi:DNA-binding LacI/PurR family transcriptional regulator